MIIAIEMIYMKKITITILMMIMTIWKTDTIIIAMISHHLKEILETIVVMTNIVALGIDISILGIITNIVVPSIVISLLAFNLFIFI